VQTGYRLVVERFNFTVRTPFSRGKLQFPTKLRAKIETNASNRFVVNRRYFLLFESFKLASYSKRYNAVTSCCSKVGPDRSSQRVRTPPNCYLICAEKVTTNTKTRETMAEQGAGNNFSSPDTFASAVQNAPEGDDSPVVPRELFDTHSSEGTSTEGGSPPGYVENFQNNESETFNLGDVMQEEAEAGDDDSVSDSEGSQDEEE
jgi:hypothetical protein